MYGFIPHRGTEFNTLCSVTIAAHIKLCISHVYHISNMFCLWQTILY